MSTENNQEDENSIVQYKRIEDAKVIVEKLSDAVWPLMQHSNLLHGERKLSRSEFVLRLKEIESEHLSFQRLFLHHLMVSGWKLDNIRAEIEKISSHHSFNEFILIHIHQDEIEGFVPTTEIFGMGKDLCGLFDRMIKATLFYSANFSSNDVTTANSQMKFSIEILNEDYLSNKGKGIRENEKKAISAFANACTDAFESTLSDRGWGILHVNGCFSRRDSYDIHHEVQIQKKKLLKLLVGYFTQYLHAHPEKKNLLKVFKVIGDNFGLYKKHIDEKNPNRNKSDVVRGYGSHLNFKSLVESSYTIGDAGNIINYDPKIRTIAFPHIVARLLRLSDWHVRQLLPCRESLDPKEIQYLKELAEANN